MKSVKPGKRISVIEILNISKFGIWILVDEREYFAAFADFPWFKAAAIGDILAVENPHAGHLYWPTLDIDLALESLENPAAYPLIAKTRKTSGRKRASKLSGT